MVKGSPLFCRLAFDGRGNAAVKTFGDLEKAVQDLGGYDQGLYGERWVSYTKVQDKTKLPERHLSIFEWQRRTSKLSAGAGCDGRSVPRWQPDAVSSH